MRRRLIDFMARESPEEILREKVVSENAHGLFLIGGYCEQTDGGFERG